MLLLCSDSAHARQEEHAMTRGLLRAATNQLQRSQHVPEVGFRCYVGCCGCGGLCGRGSRGGAARGGEGRRGAGTLPGRDPPLESSPVP